MLKDKKGISLILLVLIIVLVIAVVATTIVVVINNSNDTKASQEAGIDKDKTEDKDKDKDEDENSNSLETNKINWDDYEIVIDGISLKFPMTYNEFISKGFYPQEIPDYNPNLPLANYVLKPKVYGDSFYANYSVFTNGITNNIGLWVYNPDETAKKVSECYVIGISMEYRSGDLPQISIGEFKIINHTRGTELIMGKSTISEIDSLFGPHYKFNRSNEFTYYPDANNDGQITATEIDTEAVLKLCCDANTQILIPDQFQYVNMYK